MRNLNQLYTILHDNIKNTDKISSICSAIFQLWDSQCVTYNEYSQLKEHFQKQKPVSYFFGLFGNNKEFTRDKNYIGQLFWWDNSKNSTESRKKFVLYLIEKTK